MSVTRRNRYHIRNTSLALGRQEGHGRCSSFSATPNVVERAEPVLIDFRRLAASRFERAARWCRRYGARVGSRVLDSPRQFALPAISADLVTCSPSAVYLQRLLLTLSACPCRRQPVTVRAATIFVSGLAGFTFASGSIASPNFRILDRVTLDSRGGRPLLVPGSRSIVAAKFSSRHRGKASRVFRSRRAHLGGPFLGLLMTRSAGGLIFFLTALAATAIAIAILHVPDTDPPCRFVDSRGRAIWASGLAYISYAPSSTAAWRAWWPG